MKTTHVAFYSKIVVIFFGPNYIQAAVSSVQHAGVQRTELLYQVEDRLLTQLESHVAGRRKSPGPPPAGGQRPR